MTYVKINTIFIFCAKTFVAFESDLHIQIIFGVTVLCSLYYVRETGRPTFCSKGTIYDFISNLNRITVSRLITESAAIY